jgi:tRNA (cmo5U34)-methyltransferase
MAEQDSSPVGDAIRASSGRWSFADDTVDNFDAHIARSVPLYAECQELVARLSEFFLASDSRVYELGCSTGAMTEQIARQNEGRPVQICAIDVEPAMAEKAAQRLAGYDNVEVVCADVLDMDYRPADLFVSFLTMQFIAPRFRQQLFDRVYQSLNWGGALILVEKVRAPDARFNDMMSQLYNDYKLSAGYTPEEIIAKSRSLKGVLEPFSTQGNLDLLQRAGFVDVMSVFKYLCFEGFLAIK